MDVKTIRYSVKIEITKENPNVCYSKQCVMAVFAWVIQPEIKLYYNSYHNIFIIIHQVIRTFKLFITFLNTILIKTKKRQDTYINGDIPFFVLQSSY